jgi:hypothetical protein
MSSFVVAFVASLILVGVISSIAKCPSGTAKVCLLTGCLTVCCLFVLYPILLFQSFFTFVLAGLCGICQSRPRGIVIASLVAMTAAYALVLPDTVRQIRELHELQAQYPFESIAERLNYEMHSSDAALPPPALDPKVEQRMVTFENLAAPGRRAYSLATLHRRTANDFAVAQGFGVGRMWAVMPRRLELNEPPPTPMPTLPQSDSSASTDQPLPLAEFQEAQIRRPAEPDLLVMHADGVNEFLNPERMGYIKDREHVAGFASHRLFNIPSLLRREHGTKVHALASPWRVANLELISLLKHDTPVAYTSPYLPQLDEVQDLPTRQLTRFELSSLDRLRNDEDVVVDESPDTIRMVGSLRAARNCLECHSVQRGELLGAFTYELVPVGVKPPRKNDGDSSPPEA